MKKPLHITYLALAGLVCGELAGGAAREASANIASITVSVWLEVSTATIACQPTSFSMHCQQGERDTTASLIVWNGTAPGRLDYTILTTPQWLSCAPTAGSLTTEALSHIVSVSPMGLRAGDYAGTITITAADAANSPVTLPVHLRVVPAVSGVRRWTLFR